jgi:hypothetical protein
MLPITKCQTPTINYELPQQRRSRCSCFQIPLSSTSISYRKKNCRQENQPNAWSASSCVDRHAKEGTLRPTGFRSCSSRHQVNWQEGRFWLFRRAEVRLLAKETASPFPMDEYPASSNSEFLQLRVSEKATVTCGQNALWLEQLDGVCRKARSQYMPRQLGNFINRWHGIRHRPLKNALCSGNTTRCL